MMKKNRYLIIMVFFGLLGCQTHGTDQNTLVMITKSLGTKQCEEVNPEVKLQQLQRELDQQHIKVFAAEIGSDNMSHIALCGAEDGKMAIFKIKAHAVNQAKKLGYIQKN